MVERSMGPSGNFSRGIFVVSLDFELFWGVRDLLTLEQYGENLLGVRRVVPALLELFAQYEVRATWATVGFLFAANRDELLRRSPEEKPAYEDQNLSPYPEVLGPIGPDEKADPYRFGSSLVDLIQARGDQELATHTFSHYYCLEPGNSRAAFRADLEAAIRAGEDRGVRIESIVFPRNQVNADYLRDCRDAGIVAYRGTERSWAYAPRSLPREVQARRALRLADAYLPLTGANTHRVAPPRAGSPVNVPSSRYLRPWKPGFDRVESLRLRRILSGLDAAAERGELFHLWWHPHDFGKHPERNLAFLERILERFARLRREGRLESLQMREVAERAGVAARPPVRPVSA